MSFLYSLLLKFLYPTSLCLVLLLASAALQKRKVASRICFWLAVAILVVCGNGWVDAALVRHLERQYPPLTSQPSTLNPQPRVAGSEWQVARASEADCILVLGGGTVAKIPPRPTVEVSEAGDRVLYAAHLYRQGIAPRVICTGNVGTGGVASHPEAEDMKELLVMVGVPADAIILETDAANTHEHAKNLQALLRERNFKRVLLVTSAMHMPRSMGVFKKDCAGIEFIPAPTDFRIAEQIPAPWYQDLKALVPTPSNLLLFSEAMHEYVGIAWYRVRGWE
jgi:uncharacterized SAM-binding protein YcdF (DUF218 family)